MWVFTLLLCVALAFAAKSYHKFDIEDAEELFEEFIKNHNKHYADEDEKAWRFIIFKHNLELINRQNAKSDSAAFDINMFTDLTPEEFIIIYTGYRGLNASNCDSQEPNFKTAPDAFDWREQNKVTGIRNQERCGACWAFGAVGNLESQYAIKYNQILDFSEQQLVDCDKNSFGCSGTQDLAYPFMYWMEHGPMLEEDYKYEGSDGTCRADDSKAKAKISGCVAYSTNDEEALKKALHDVGPLAIAIDATSIMHYNHGVMDGCTCNSINHAVLLVGYGTEKDIPFWVIKNSWGADWGEDGFFKVKRGVNSCCMMDDTMVTAVLA
ncbi:cysteine proteinase B-like [Epargyreus clarus]|uniref:cysteine proteinase B-like n=1 Tax=Epargyreus clarus TaxID=520877 RepID=UPI003C30B7B7